MAGPDIQGRFDLPFAEQLAFLRRKLNIPTERWDDLMREESGAPLLGAGVQLLEPARKAL